MKKALIGRKMYAFLALLLGFAMAGCGGGGGGGGTTAAPAAGGNPTTTNTTFTVSGTLTGLPAAARVAGREAGAPLANTAVIVYVLGDANHTALNANAVTDINGNFSITVDIGRVANADIIIEGLTGAAGAATNVKIPLENAAANVSALTGNETTTAKAELWTSNTSEGLAATVAPIVDMFSNQGLTIANVRTVIATTAKGQALVSALKTVVSGCASSSTDAAKRDCIITAIDAKLADISDSSVKSLVGDLQREYVSDRLNTTDATSADKLKFLVPDATYDTLNAIIAIAQEAKAYAQDVNVEDRQWTKPEAEELVAKMAEAVAAYKAGSAGAARSVAVKNALLASLKADVFTNSPPKTEFVYMVSGYQGKIAAQATEGQTRVTTQDMSSLISAYDTVRGALAKIFVDNAAVTRPVGWQMVDGLIYSLKMLGSSSENNTSMGGILDDWVPAYAEASYRDNIHYLFDPLEMTPRAKSQYYMELAHDLQAAGGGREQVLGVLNAYVAAGKLNQPTVTEVMRLYDKYAGTMDCSFSVTTRTIAGSNCITQAEILNVLQLHYEKNLPKVDAVMTAIQEWVRTSNDALGLASASSALQRIYNDMKASPAAKSEIGAALDKAGVNKELFWLVMNVEPYM